MFCILEQQFFFEYQEYWISPKTLVCLNYISAWAWMLWIFYGSIISYVALFDFIFQMNGYLYSLCKNRFQSCNYLCTLMQDIIIYYDLYCLDLLICQDPLKYYSIILMDQMLCWTYLHLELNSSLMVVFNCFVKICFLLLF